MAINFLSGDLTQTLAGAAILGSVCAIAGYFLMRKKFLVELKKGEAREAELSRKVYEIALLKEIGDRIGHSLDAFGL